MIYFAGNFIRNHNITMECISHALDYFSQHDDESINAIFLKHDGFVGALGCILEGKNSDSIKE
jgi:type II pantothenate kinase